MRFTIPLIAAAAALTSAVAIPQPDAMNITLSDGIYFEVVEFSSESLQKRQTPSPNVQVIGDKAGAAGVAVGRVLNAILNKLFPLKDWNPARETFTKETTSLMYNNNPDRNRWVAAACYNKAWAVKDYGAISDVVSMKLKLGAFHTDYDCMYIGRHNQFWTESDNGYINLAYAYNGNICSFDGSTGDLTCN